MPNKALTDFEEPRPQTIKVISNPPTTLGATFEKPFRGLQFDVFSNLMVVHRNWILQICINKITDAIRTDSRFHLILRFPIERYDGLLISIKNYYFLFGGSNISMQSKFLFLTVCYNGKSWK